MCPHPLAEIPPVFIAPQPAPTTHILRETLSEIQQKLPPDMFLRISRSAVVALRQVRCLENDSTGKPVAILHDGVRISVTRSAHELRSLLG